MIKNVDKMSDRELRCEVRSLRRTLDRIHKHAVAHWRYKGEDGWLKVMQLSDPGQPDPDPGPVRYADSGYHRRSVLLTALREIGYGVDNGQPNGGIMCRAIARAAIDDFAPKGECERLGHHVCGPKQDGYG